MFGLAIILALVGAAQLAKGLVHREECEPWILEVLIGVAVLLLDTLLVAWYLGWFDGP